MMTIFSSKKCHLYKSKAAFTFLFSIDAWNFYRKIKPQIIHHEWLITYKTAFNYLCRLVNQKSVKSNSIIHTTTEWVFAYTVWVSQKVHSQYANLKYVMINFLWPKDEAHCPLGKWCYRQKQELLIDIPNQIMGTKWAFILIFKCFFNIY